MGWKLYQAEFRTSATFKKKLDMPDPQPDPQPAQGPVYIF